MNSENRERSIESLQKEIKDKDRDIHLAAKFGKQLLDEKEALGNRLDDLHSRNEILEQERYSLQGSLKTQIETVHSQSSEIETQRKEIDELMKKAEILETEKSRNEQKIKNLVKEKANLEKGCEDAILEISTLKKKNDSLQQQIGNFQHVNEISMIETGQEEILESQLNLCVAKNKELEDILVDMQCELDSMKLKETRLNNLVKELEEGVYDRDKEIAAFSVERQSSQAAYVELQCELERLKMEPLDAKRRGNSVFGELDDRRKLVEQEYKTLLKKYSNIKKNYDENKNELVKCKGQMSILLSMTSRSYQEEHIEKLEATVAEKKAEVEELSIKLTKALKSQQQQQPSIEKSSGRIEDYGYLRVMLAQAEKKIKTLENEWMDMRMQNTEKVEKLTQTQRILYQTQKDLDTTRAENTRLKAEIYELTFKPELMVSAKSKPKREAIPGFNTSQNKDPENDQSKENILVEKNSEVEVNNSKLDYDNLISNKSSRENRSEKKDMGCAQQ